MDSEPQRIKSDVSASRFILGVCRSIRFRTHTSLSDASSAPFGCGAGKRTAVYRAHRKLNSFARGSLLGGGVKKRPRAMAAAPGTMVEEDAMGMRAAQAKMHGVVWIKQRRWPMLLPMACSFIGLLWKKCF